MSTHAETVGARVSARELRAQALRYGLRGLIAAIVVFLVVWVLFAADNAAIHDPTLFWRITLNAITLAGLYFVVASGFTLIFGLMRVVNMAHGSLFLLGGYITYEVAANWGNWGSGLVISMLGIAAIGVLMQQGFLRWNQGQDLRQALITIAISIIMADQMLGFFGGVPKNLQWPPPLDFQVDVGIEYPFTRIFVLLCALAVGGLLYLWLKRTRTGMIIRAGVDDRQMVSALGVNIQLVFALAFAVGSALAALGGTLFGSGAGLAPGIDGEFLLNALIVVIIGGMGSLGGAAIGAVLYGAVDSYSDIYLPSGYTNYSVLIVFGLLVLVLAVKPYGLFGRPA